MPTYIIILFVIGLLVLVALSAVFSAAETAYSTVPRTIVEQKAKQRKRSALLIKKHYHQYGWTVATILIGNNVVNIASSSLATYLLSHLIDADVLVSVISIAVMTPLIVVFGEIAPKLLAKKKPYQYLSLVVYLIEVLNYLFFPFTFPLKKLALQSKVTNSEAEIKQLISIAQNEGVLEKQEATLVQKALDLDSTNISSIMTKRDDISYLENGITVKEAKERFAITGHSRMPLKIGENFTGMILLKDIVFEDETLRVNGFAKKIVLVSKNTLATKALEKMRASRSQIALVTSSQQSQLVVGLVTIEDIVEELVGEIYDEHDDSHALVREIAHFKWIVRGDVKLVDVSKEIGIKFDPEYELDTVREFVAKRSKKRIKNNLKITFKKYTFKVVVNQKSEEPIFQISKK